MEQRVHSTLLLIHEGIQHTWNQTVDTFNLNHLNFIQFTDIVKENCGQEAEFSHVFLLTLQGVQTCCPFSFMMRGLKNHLVSLHWNYI